MELLKLSLHPNLKVMAQFSNAILYLLGQQALGQDMLYKCTIIKATMSFLLVKLGCQADLDTFNPLRTWDSVPRLDFVILRIKHTGLN